MVLASSYSHPTLLLVDGSSYLFRAFYALPALMNREHVPTGALYGVINMLKKLLQEYTPTYIGVVFDAPGKTFRDTLYPEYKANRKATPDALICQIPPLLETIQALGFPLIAIPEVEADDVIGTLATRATTAGHSTVISTGDKDMAQLVNEQVTLVNTMTGEVLDIHGVQKKFGILPTQMVDYLMLVGDSVDNIPGVPGVGPKTASKWLQTYGSLREIIQHADQITGKVGENLRATIPQFELTRKLVTIDTQLTQTPSFETLTKHPPQPEKLIKIFKEFEFKSWLRELEMTDTNPIPPKTTKNYKTILTMDAFNDWLQRLQNAPQFAIDTETTSLNTIDAILVGLSFAIEPHEAIYIPLGHDYANAPPQLDRAQILEKLKPILEDTTHIKIGHNLKYDIEVLANYHISIQGTLRDSMLESYILNSTASRHAMDTLALKYLDYQTIPFDAVAATGKRGKLLTFNQVSIEPATRYAAEDADITLQLHQIFFKKLSTIPPLQSVYTNIEIPLVPVLARMERKGVFIDKKVLHIQSQNLAQKIDSLQEKAYRLAGQPFNLSSPKQLQEILFKKMGLPILSKTPTGQAATGEEVLQELAAEYPLPAVILEYRTLSKLKSTYTDSLPLQIHPKTGRVHTSFNQAVTATGRLSSSDPNLQNIPARTEEGRRIRQAFVAPSGYKIVAADYSQIELRIMAHLSQDKGLLQAFEQGLDIHKATAAEVFGVPLAEVTPHQRRHAKAINFGLIYGMSAFGLSKQLNIPREAAENYMNLYFARYPGAKIYMEQTRTFAKSTGYVETVFGRRLYLPDIHAHNLQKQRAAERAAINAPMQGTAADIIKRAMIAVDAWLEHSRLPAYMTMQVHDELVLEVEASVLTEVAIGLQKHMMSAAALAVPLVVDIGIGNNWDEAH